MANYYETARTNYFRVKDKSAFMAFIDRLSGATVVDDPEGRLAVLFKEEGVPSSLYNEETEDYDDFDFMSELAAHLADNSVAVLVGAGAEKLRYVSGYAVAITNKGEAVSININAIYPLAEKTFGSEAEVTAAEY